MLVLQIITLSEPIGGAQMVLLNNAQQMVKNGCEMHVVVGQTGTLTKHLAQMGISFSCLPELVRQISPIQDFKCYKALQRLFDKQQPDIVISHSSKAGILVRLACYKKKIRNIFTVHGWSFTPGVKGLQRYFYLILEKVMGYFTDRLIAVSDYDKALALKYHIVPESKIRVVHNGSPDLKDAECIPPLIFTVLMVARFQPQKDHLTLFKALQLLKREPLKVDLVGSGEHLSQFKRLAKAMEIDELITFHGERSDVSNFLNRSSIFALISKFEGLPLSICEAMSVGLPIVATDVGGISEMVIEGHNGFLIPKEDHILLAERLKTLLEDQALLQKMGQNARSVYQTSFSIAQMASSTQKYIHDIVQKR